VTRGQGIRRRRLELALQRAFAAAVLRYCEEGAREDDADAVELAREIDRLDDEERARRGACSSSRHT